MASDDSADAIRGELLIPRGTFRGDQATRREASDCPGCVWRLVADCTEDDSLCLAAIATCPPGETRFEIQLLRPDVTEFVEVGTVCLGARTPRTPQQAAAQLRDRFIELLPTLLPTFQPTAGGLVNLPTLYATGQPAGFGPTDTRLGPFDVVITATPTWVWTFGDGETLPTTDPGGPWPDTSVGHSYREPGNYPVSVTTTWSGSFTVDGLGPFPIDGAPVTQTADLTVPVREARSRLVGG